MRVLCTFPGRAGDLMWALPAVRAVSEHFQVPVDLGIAGEFEGMVPLLRQQPYIAAAWAWENWSLTPPADWQPPNTHIGGYDRTYHLGYRGWPAKPLPFETQDTLAVVWDLEDGPIPEIDLGRAWITVTGPGAPTDLAVGFTEAWFELKLGLLVALERLSPYVPRLLLTPPGSRWTTEVPPGTVSVYPCGWLNAARAIRNSDLFLGDCSALHVLAVAMGKPVLLVESMEARHNEIFYPLGKTGRVRLLTGNDGLPTFDARHCADALKEMLAHV